MRPHPARANRRKPITEHEEEPFAAFERVVWTLIAAFSTVVVWLSDGLVFIAGLWLLGIVAFGQLALPWIFRRAHDFVSRNDNLYVGVILGWGLVPGPLVGVLFGVLLPFIYDCGLGSFAGGLIGMIVGPCFAVFQGLTIVCIVDAAVWITTGTSASRKSI